MSEENDKIFRTLEHIAITFDKLGYSPTIPIFKGHQDFEWLFKLELDTIKALCNQQDQKITDLEAKLAEKELELQQKNKLIIQEDGECILCGDCYCINNDVRKIVEENILLKQQLAESEEKFKAMKTLREMVNEDSKLNFKRYIDTLARNEQLEQQLEEKEGKIETLKQRIDSIVKIYSNDFVSKDTELKELRHKVKEHDQDKISFTLEQLEEIINIFEPYENEEKDTILCVNNGVSFLEYVEDKIKQLKEKK